MNDPRWTTVDGLLEATLERQPHEREAFLREACPDEALRREVESLLAHADTGGSFLDEPALEVMGRSGGDRSHQALVGRHIGSHRIVGLLGSGGMGEVYRAHDTRLGREVAIKILPRIFGTDPDRRARFDREARLLAALNHPHIGAIYGVEESDGVRALVLELVEGETLADRLARGPVSIDEALPMARQIAEALEAAHEKGIVHRDLKPANIKITPDGIVKVLDFGLAKAAGPAEAGHDVPDATQSPTMTIGGTREGVILGTAAYMSPEQARGKPVDKRADIWAFGCVLFELLTGRAAFARDTVTDTLAAILERDPDWTAVPSGVPPAIRRLLRRCLQKDRSRRLDSAAAIRIELDEAYTEPDATSPRSRGGWRRPSAAVAVLLVFVVVMTIPAVRYFNQAPRDTPETRLEMSTPPTSLPLQFALSPDGRSIVFVASADGPQRLWLRTLDKTDARPMAGTDGAEYPFWSPDGRSIGFCTSGKLYRIDVAGGAAQKLAEGGSCSGGSWSADGTILYAPNIFGPIFKVAESGGEPVRVTQADAAPGTGHRFPAFLPDGRHFLFYAFGPPEVLGIYVGSLDGGEPKRLMAADTRGAFLPPDRIAYIREGTLLVRQLDLSREELIGDPVTLADGVGYEMTTGWGAFSVSRNGTVAYRAGLPLRQLRWYDRTGTPLGAIGKPDANDLQGPALSPDEQAVAVTRTVQQNTGIWLIDLRRGSVTPITTDAGVEAHGIWSPGSERIAYESSRKWDMYTSPSTGAGPEELLLLNDLALQRPQDWSRHGYLLYDQLEANSQHDIWTLEMSGNGRKATPFVTTAADERNSQFSPDGHWIAYETNESGDYQIIVESFPTRTRTWPVSINGGVQPRWSRDGKQLYFIGPGSTLMVAPVTTSASVFDAGAPEVLFTTRIVTGRIPEIHAQYAVSRDGRFLINENTEDSVAPITLILNWKPN